MPNRTALLVAATTMAAATPTIAGAASVETDRGCYLQQSTTTVSVRGSGFTAGAPFAVKLDDAPLEGGSSVIGSDGTMSGSFAPPVLESDDYQRRFKLGLDTAQASASTYFTVTRLLATYSPNRGSVATTKVRFSLFGFALGGPVSQAYLHYISPAGKSVKTVALGRPSGQCGSIPRTSKRKLFPFKKVCTGTWRLQFDTRRTYRAGSSKSPFLYYTLKVPVSGAKRISCS